MPKTAALERRTTLHPCTLYKKHLPWAEELLHVVYMEFNPPFADPQMKTDGINSIFTMSIALQASDSLHCRYLLQQEFPAYY
ncbi:hypothetical protein CEXT_571711 [Caerostris extrusa]|uniref:Uncharacterized protein n=1 Tax=Caerostris extrusa TaxID=172846 RepID=A0AAV4PLX9_CAEEX|nr:hypothetical protein CEXT_571711 [Caerostris extrusa]